MTRAGDDKVLILFRHAKAEQAPGKADHERELTGRGRRDAAAAGHGCTSRGSVPSWCCARRPPVPARPGRRRPRRALRRDRRVPPQHLLRRVGRRPCSRRCARPAVRPQVVLVVGHNPTMAQLASGLTEGDGLARGATSALAAGFCPRPAWRCCATRGTGPTSTSARRARAVPRQPAEGVATAMPLVRDRVPRCGRPTLDCDMTTTDPLQGMTQRRHQAPQPRRHRRPREDRRARDAPRRGPRRRRLGQAADRRRELVERDHAVQPLARPARQGRQGRRARRRRLPARVRHDLGLATASRWATRACTSRLVSAARSSPTPSRR